MTKDKKNNDSFKAKIDVMMALEATEPVSRQTCPTDETMALFVDGRLDEMERQKVLDHLNECRRCYSQWIEMTSALEEVDRESLHTRHKNRRFYLGSGVAAAAAACLVVIIIGRLYFFAPHMSGLLQDSYLSASRENLIGSPGQLPAPWVLLERSRGEFADPRQKAAQALEDGFAAGNDILAATVAHKLPKADRWEDTGFRLYYHLGLWCYLLEAVCASGKEAPASYWKLQEKTASRFVKAFADLPQRDIAGYLAKIMAEIQEDITNSPTGYAYSHENVCGSIAPHLRLIKETFAKAP